MSVGGGREVDEWVNKPSARVAVAPDNSSPSSIVTAITPGAADWRPRYIESNAPSERKERHDVGESKSEDATTGQWNTKNLGMRVGADLTAAACAGILVAPIITIIDK